MDEAVFYKSVRSIYGGSLSQPQVDGIGAILDSCRRHSVVNPHHVANILANVKRETGGYMSPIKETVYVSHKDKNPSDATVKRRLENAWKKGQLSWVKTPYWRDGAFGRGMIQITHWPNYDKLGRILGIQLRENPDLALDLKISADIAVVGMSEGLFTGKKLSDYRFPGDLTAAPAAHPRRIVNGQDGTDKEIARYHRSFYSALIEAGYDEMDEASAKPAQKPVSAPATKPTPITPAKPASAWRAFFEVLLAIFRRKV